MSLGYGFLFTPGLSGEIVNTLLGKLTADKPSAAANGVTAPTVDFLLGKLEGALTAVKTQLAAENKTAALTTVTTNPFDDFRDRQAFLDIARSARNASSLDELHDLGNAALVRINLQTTVIPDQAHPKSLGAMQVSIDQGSFDDTAKSQFLEEWLNHLNRSGPQRAGGAFKADADAIQLVNSGDMVLFDVGGYQYAFPSEPPGKSRYGLIADLKAARWPETPDFGKSRDRMSSHIVNPAPRQRIFQALCNSSLANSLTETEQPEKNDLQQDIRIITARIVTFQYVNALDRWEKLRGAAVFSGGAKEKLEEASRFLASLHKSMELTPGCSDAAQQLPSSSGAITWGRLSTVLDEATKTGTVRVYEVGPREHVQQMSTVARNANSLALAASLVATAPTSGAAADAAIGYSRQAIGRATTLERVPSVVGYTIGGKQTFGWVFGPRPWLDPKGSIDVEQMLKPYDLTVDLSVPIWWPSIKLKVTTLWGPSPQDLVRGALKTDTADTQSVGVKMSRRTPDYDWFTQSITGTPSRAPKIMNVAGGPINACTPSTLLVSGRNVWRTAKVLVLGQLLDGDAITIAPDMDGVVLSIPAITPLAGGQERDPSLHLMTPFGRDLYTNLAYASSPSGDDCKPKKAEAAPGLTKVSIDSISPSLVFRLPGDFSIDFNGKNLDKITRVTLHGQPGALQPTGTTQLTVLFTTAGTSAIPASDAIPLEFFSKKGANEEKIDSRLARIVR
ncbi:hypothetical protein ACAN107058_20985 [Paracidovorax anthurii]